MRWLRRDRLPRDVEQAVGALVPDGTETRVLAWGRDDAPPAGEAAYAVGLPSLLAYQQDGSWHTIAWHRIARGGWNTETQRLGWVDYDGGRGEVPLSRPGSLPQLFKERVETSILVQRQVPVPGTKHGVVVVGRRVLGEEPPVLQWHASLNTGTTWSAPGAREAAEQALAELKADYDPYGG